MSSQDYCVLKTKASVFSEGDALEVEARNVNEVRAVITMLCALFTGRAFNKPLFKQIICTATGYVVNQKARDTFWKECVEYSRMFFIAHSIDGDEFTNKVLDAFERARRPALRVV